jgi:CYTH domain-containing protein
MAELDVFEGAFAPRVLVEVEFATEAQANAFVPPEWFGEDVTFDGRYHNSYMSGLKI